MITFDTLHKIINSKIVDDELCYQHLSPLFRHWRNIIGQSRFYSQTEIETHISLAQKNAELVILLPSIDKLPTETVGKLYGLYGMALSVVSDSLSLFFSPTRGLFDSCCPVTPRNDESYFWSWFHLFEKSKYYYQCKEALVKHTFDNPVALQMHTLVHLTEAPSESDKLPEENRLLLEKQKEELERLQKGLQPESFKYLRKHFLETTQRIIPDASERESLINLALGKFSDQLRGMPPQKRIAEYKNAKTAVKRDLIDYVKKQRRQKRNPKGGFVSLNILTPEQHTQPKEELPSETDPYDALVTDIRDTLGDTVGNIAKVYFEIYLNLEKPKKPKIQEVAKSLGINRKTVSRAIKMIENFCLKRMKKN